MRWIGHAGLARSRPAGAPDHACLERAVALRLDMLEVDVAATADGALVLLHDLRLRDGRRIESLSLAGLRAALPGVLTLDEAAEHLAGGLPLLVDLKGAAVVVPLARRLRTWGPGRADLVVCSDDLPALLTIRHTAPAIPRWRCLPATDSNRPGEGRRRALAVALRWRLAGRLQLWAREVAAAGVSVDHLALTAELGSRAAGLGLEVAAWTVNSAWAARRAAARGAGWITSDAPRGSHL